MEVVVSCCNMKSSPVSAGSRVSGSQFPRCVGVGVGGIGRGQASASEAWNLGWGYQAVENSASVLRLGD